MEVGIGGCLRMLGTMGYFIKGSTGCLVWGRLTEGQKDHI